jgi:RNA polymerase sigma-70 factor (ECF subfamily)
MRAAMDALLRAFGEEAGSAAARMVEGDGAATARVLTALYARGRLANPGLAVSEEAFGRYLARCANGAGHWVAEPLSALVAEDVYLACACTVRSRGAVAAFERRFGPVIRRAVSRVLDTPDERQEAEQRARQHLLVEETKGPPRIARYLGEGPLEKWISVACMRVAIAFGRAESAERQLREKAIAEAAGVDPDALMGRRDVRSAFERAVTESLARLNPRERLVLKLYLVSGMTIDAIGKSLGVTRQAVSKTLARAREQIIEEVQKSVQHDLKMTNEELTSILRFVASQLDLSISRSLGKT